MKLIVGLGNPGNEYAKTRHNVGFMVVDNFVEDGKRKMESGKWKGEWQEIVIDGLPNGQVNQKIVFLKPMEFMNRSGGAVSTIANFYKIETKDILVIHDDIDLPVGKVQLKLGGSSAGHNGLKDIIAQLGTKEFWRLRIGVDRPSNQFDVAEYVLSPFKKEEKKSVDEKGYEIENKISEFLNS